MKRKKEKKMKIRISRRNGKPSKNERADRSR
jgi:hypothetical protein